MLMVESETAVRARGIPVVVSVGCAGRILKNEDRLKLEEAAIGGEELLFALVADGHGGANAAMCASAQV